MISLEKLEIILNIMNFKLIVHIEPEYLCAGILPLPGKFQLMTKRGNPYFPFFFMIDNVNFKIDYSPSYANDFLKQNSDFIKLNTYYIGDFLERIACSDLLKFKSYEIETIQLLLPIYQDIKNSYFERIRKFENIDTNFQIPLMLSFSDLIVAEKREIFFNFFKAQTTEVELTPIPFSLNLVQGLIASKKMTFNIGKYLVINAMYHDLSISMIHIYNEYDRECSKMATYKDYGVDPRMRIIARKIVDDINRAEGVLTDDIQINREYKRQYIKAIDVIQSMQDNNSPYITVSTTFENDTSKIRTTNISVKEIEDETFMYIRQISRLCDDFLKNSEMDINVIEKFVMVGNTLGNELIKKEFSRFGNHKLVFVGDESVELVIQTILEPNVVEIEKTDMFQEVQKSNTKLNVFSLQVGQIVWITDDDGLEQTTKKLKYEGGNKFVVVEKIGKLEKNDICSALSIEWEIGKQLFFAVERNSKALGQYKTRVVTEFLIR